MMKNTFYKFFLATVCAVALYLISRNSINQYTSSDPQLTLLTSQSILEHGTTNLYSYYKSVTPDEFADGTWKYSAWENQKKVYYFYPSGASILCLPIVGIARLAGYDFLQKKDDALWQSIIASMCLAVIFILLVILASPFISYELAIIISFLTCLSTSIISTIGLALWSFDFEVIFLLLAMIHLSKVYTQPENSNGIRLGVFIFIAWLCRPSALIVAILMATWLFLYNKKELKKFLLTFLILLAPFTLYSITNFGTFVPRYYNPLFWSHPPPIDESFISKLLAVLFSPARGLFIFTPLFLLSFVGLFSKEIRKNNLYAFSFVWFLIHTIMLARQWCWWGGWSFGPRLFTDAFPPLLIMLLITYYKMKTTVGGKILISMFILLALPGIYIHTIKGANDIATYKWNDGPAIDENIDFYSWNFEYPQFFADSISNEIKNEKFIVLKGLKNSSLKLKEGDYLFFGNNSSVTCDMVKEMNAKNESNRIHLLCNFNDLQNEKVDSFYIPTNLYTTFNADSNYTLSTPRLRSLGSYLKEHESEHIFILTKFELLEKMSDGTKKYFKDAGSVFYNFIRKRGFFIHLYKGKKVEELIILNQDITYAYTINGHLIDAFSDGKTKASIKLNEKEHCFNDKGFNIVCVNKEGQLMDATRFNTHDIDAEFFYTFKVYKKKRSLSNVSK
jgi:hypothetical protein